MGQTFTAKSSITIQADVSRVWEALTKPELVKQYFFGVELVSDWKMGSTILYRGQWEGKQFEDKGKIVEIEPARKLVVDYWSSFSGTEDRPENYQRVTYALAPEKSGTTLTIEQTNIGSAEQCSHAEQNWRTVLGGLKQLLEK